MSILKRLVMTTMLGLSLAGGLLLGGCDKKITITQVPVFYTPQLKSIAVASFRNQTPVKGAGEIIADQVAAGLMANGAYKVYNRNDLKAVMDENDLQMALSDNPTAAANGLKKLTQVQAILVGTVTTYSATTTSQQRREPVYAYTKKGKAYITGYRTVVDRRNEGNVVVTATLIRVSDGSTIYATPQPISYTAWAEGKGTPPKMDPHACLAKAATMTAGGIVSTFAPSRQQIKIDKGKALRTATELYDNKWTYEDTFGVNDEKMYVVVSLPACCDRNRFRIAIVRKGERRDLATQDVVWSRKHAGFGYIFSPKDIAAKGGGPGEYEVKFYSGPEPILRRKFKIK